MVAVGVGLIGAGLFTTDPMNGCPPGTPLVPTQYSVAGRLHRSLSALVLFGLPLASFSLGRWFDRRGHRSWAIYSGLTGVSFLAFFLLASVGFFQVSGLAAFAGLFQRTSLSVGWIWLTLLALRMLRGPIAVPPADAAPSAAAPSKG
jgi:hypothetical protein